MFQEGYVFVNLFLFGRNRGKQRVLFLDPEGLLCRSPQNDFGLNDEDVRIHGLHSGQMSVLIVFCGPRLPLSFQFVCGPSGRFPFVWLHRRGGPVFVERITFTNNCRPYGVHDVPFFGNRRGNLFSICSGDAFFQVAKKRE